MPIEGSEHRANISRPFTSAKEGLEQLKEKIRLSNKVRISNISVELLDELLPALKGKDVKIILHHEVTPTEQMKEIGDLAIQKDRISSNFEGVEADVCSIYFSTVVFRITWTEGKILQITTMRYNKYIRWFEMGWRYATRIH